jgi:hypothetical protein
MRALGIFLIGVVVLPLRAQQNATSSSSVQACREFSFDGRINGEEEYARRLGDRLWLRLSPLKDSWGWIIQLQPEGRNDDYAFPLNPPFHGDNGQWLGTGYGETAEERLKFEHRIFFAASQEEYERDASLYEEYLDNPRNQDPSAAAKFLAMLPSLRTAVMKLKPVKYETTNERKSVSWMEFSVTVVVPEKFQPAADIKTKSATCPSGEF